MVYKKLTAQGVCPIADQEINLKYELLYGESSTGWCLVSILSNQKTLKLLEIYSKKMHIKILNFLKVKLLLYSREELI